MRGFHFIASDHRAQVGLVGSYKCPSAHISCIYVYFIINNKINIYTWNVCTWALIGANYLGPVPQIVR